MKIETIAVRGGYSPDPIPGRLPCRLDDQIADLDQALSAA